MFVESVKKYKEPLYPDKKVVMDDPVMLKSMPNRWKNNVKAAVALSALLAMVSGCGRSVNSGNTNDKTSIVAPIFEHGDGRGSYGCVSIAPPAFLSEDEAYDVISTEAEKFGISFEQNELTLEEVKIPKTTYNLNEGQKIKSSRKGNLLLDGSDSDNKISFEFVSELDYDKWNTDEGMYSTIETRDFKSAAQVLRKGLKGKTENHSVGVFYDPVPEIDFEKVRDDSISYEEELQMRKDEAAELLKEQVKDFFEWLKGEGII